jgi:hypothetical protein
LRAIRAGDAYAKMHRGGEIRVQIKVISEEDEAGIANRPPTAVEEPNRNSAPDMPLGSPTSLLLAEA